MNYYSLSAFRVNIKAQKVNPFQEPKQVMKYDQNQTYYQMQVIETEHDIITTNQVPKKKINNFNPNRVKLQKVNPNQERIKGKSTLPPKFQGFFQFEPQNLKIGNLPPNVSKIFNLNFLLLISIKLNGNL